MVDNDGGVEVGLSPLFSDYETDGSGPESADERHDSGGPQMAMSDSANTEFVVNTSGEVARRSVCAKKVLSQMLCLLTRHL